MFRTLTRKPYRLLAAAGAVLAATLVTAAWRRAHQPRAWRPGEPPVAFWTWRTETPTQAEVERASNETGARSLFLRAGQFDLKAWRVERVRAVEGRMPRGVELHLVYNATPRLLEEFGRVDEKELGAVFVETFRTDAARAARDGAQVSGLQLDMDVPTRLLTRYARVLRETRFQLPAGVKLSVTGLPTWMESREVERVLAEVDFWAPQFYGAEIPATADRIIPIASPLEVARDVARARELGKPFYAGLAAYGQAIVYDANGQLAELRGDLDPARVASDSNLELVGRRAHRAGVEGDGARAVAAPPAGEWRYVFRARSDTVIDGLTVRAGEQIVLEVPGSESLRASVRGVREAAGDKLLGICLFRLPTRGDATTLPLKVMAAALQDREAEFSTSLKVAGSDEEGAANLLVLKAENDGASGAVYGEGALTLTLRVPRGGLRGVTRLEGFDTFETLCEWDGALQPCGAARAEFVRLGARAWPAGARASAGLSFEGEAPSALEAKVAARRDDGRVWERSVSVGARGASGR